MPVIREIPVQDEELLKDVEDAFDKIDRAVAVELRANVLVEEPLKKAPKEFEAIRF